MQKSYNFAVLIAFICLNGCFSSEADGSHGCTTAEDRCADAPARIAPLCWAEDLAEHVPPEFNEHGGDPTIMRWEGVDGATRYENRSRTAGFVSGVIAKAGLMTLEMCNEFGGSCTPFASDFSCAGTEKEVTRVQDIVAADVVVIDFDPSEPVVELDGEGHLVEVRGTGQLAIARGPVEPISAGAVCDPTSADMTGRAQFELDVVDSATIPHGPTDSRAPNQDGVGFGPMRLFADEEGRIVGYSWSPSHSTCREPSKQQLVICRYWGE